MRNIIGQEKSAGKDTIGLAATVLYQSGLKYGESISQTQITRAAGITEVTLRNRSKDLKEEKPLLD